MMNEKMIKDEIEWCEDLLAWASGDDYLKYEQQIKDLRKQLRGDE